MILFFIHVLYYPFPEVDDDQQYLDPKAVECGTDLIFGDINFGIGDFSVTGIFKILV